MEVTLEADVAIHRAVARASGTPLFALILAAPGPLHLSSRRHARPPWPRAGPNRRRLLLRHQERYANRRPTHPFGLPAGSKRTHVNHRLSGDLKARINLSTWSSSTRHLRQAAASSAPRHVSGSSHGEPSVRCECAQRAHSCDPPPFEPRRFARRFPTDLPASVRLLARLKLVEMSLDLGVGEQASPCRCAFRATWSGVRPQPVAFWSRQKPPISPS